MVLHSNDNGVTERHVIESDGDDVRESRLWCYREAFDEVTGGECLELEGLDIVVQEQLEIRFTHL
jgi:hypothetical protein